MRPGAAQDGSRPSAHRHRAGRLTATQRGFTLLEVLVAVAVIALSLGAVLSGMARHAANTAQLRDRTIAMFVAHNRLTELRLSATWPETGASDGAETMAGRRWRWRAEVSETEDPALRRIDLTVRAEDGEQDLAALTGFVIQP